MLHRTIGVVALGAALGLAPAAFAASTRTHVSNAGSDANTAFSCDSAHPCRTFATALAQTTPGGEILAIDSSGYGKVVIDRSVSIIAAPGVFAGIGVGSGNGVTIATAGIDVVLRGLTITGQGGSLGVFMTDGARLTIDGCVFSNFSTGYGVAVLAPASLRIADSVFLDNFHGVILGKGADASISASRIYGGSTALMLSDTWGGSGTTSASVDRSVFKGSTMDAVHADAGLSGNASVLQVSDSVISGAGNGVLARGLGGGLARVTVTNSRVTGNTIGLRSWGSGAKLIAGGNAVTQNGTGLQAWSGGTFESSGDNLVRDNGTAVEGTVTVFDKR